MSEIRYDGRVAIVTGAGGGLGKTYALMLASRGASVVVNDLGGASDGTGGGSSMADEVVKQINESGGKAVANYDSVASPEGGEAICKAAVDNFGKVDIVVNNAGILRDKSFLKMELEDFFRVIAVHLDGSVHCTKAVWELMRDQGYGRIALTTSSSGLYGNFGQANYSAAKMGLVGLMNTLVIEGLKYDIRVNTLSPCAATRMTEDLMKPEVLELLAPASVTAGLLYLVSEDAPNRAILAAGGGTFARAAIYETPGIHLKEEDCTPEGVAAHWDAITATEGQTEYQSGSDQTVNLLTTAARSLGIDLG